MSSIAKATERLHHTSGSPRFPVTGSYDIRFCHEVKDHSSSGEVFQIWENKSSGIKFTHPAPSPETIGSYYEMDEYLSHDSQGESTFATVYRYARNITLKWKFRLIKNRLPVAAVRLLDFGAGTGDFASFVRKQKPGWQVKAIETDPGAAEQIAQKDAKISVYPKLDSFPKSEKFGVITAWHALEHVHRPDQILEQFHKRLFEYGVLIIAVPNSNSFDARHYASDWAGYDVPRHLFHFTPEAFTRLAESKGFRVVEKKRMLLDAFYVSLLSESYRGNNGLKAFTKASLVGLWSNMLCLVNAGRCSSVTYILRKNDTD